jgi:glutathione S-transferase
MKSSENRLLTIPISHYCEKARWALEWSNIPYSEERHLQGFHYFYSYKWANSPSAPVLRTPTRVFTDSTDIIQWCDSLAPVQRKLRPMDDKLRQEADRLEDYFDEELGVAGRLWMYTYMLNEIPLILRYSKIHGVPGYEIKLMPILFPLLKGHIHRVLKLTPTSQEDTRKRVQRVFDDVAQKIEGKEFLVANTFTSADLSFAALAASVLIPNNYGVSLPALEELPKAMQEQIILWRQHPAGRFALRIYRDFRGR